MLQKLKKSTALIMCVLMCISMLTCIVLPASAVTDASESADAYAATNAHATVATVSEGKINVNGTDVTVPADYAGEDIYIPDARMYFYDPEWNATELGIDGNEGDIFFVRYGNDATGSEWGNGKVYVLTWRVNAFGDTQYNAVTDLDGTTVLKKAGSYDGYTDMVNKLRHITPVVGEDNSQYVILFPGDMNKNTNSGGTDNHTYATAAPTADKATVAEFEQSDYTNVYFYGPQAGKDPTSGVVGDTTLSNGRSVNIDKEIVFNAWFYFPYNAVYHFDGIAMKVGIYQNKLTDANRVSGMYLKNMYFEMNKSDTWLNVGQSVCGEGTTATVFHMTDCYFYGKIEITSGSVNYLKASDLLFDNVVVTNLTTKSSRLRFTPNAYIDTAFLGEYRKKAHYEVINSTFDYTKGSVSIFSGYLQDYDSYDSAEVIFDNNYMGGYIEDFFELASGSGTINADLTVTNNTIVAHKDAERAAIYAKSASLDTNTQWTVKNNTFISDPTLKTAVDFNGCPWFDASDNLYLDYDGNVRAVMVKNSKVNVVSDIYADAAKDAGVSELFTVKKTAQDLPLLGSSIDLTTTTAQKYFSGTVYVNPKEGVTYTTDGLFVYDDDKVELLGFYSDADCTTEISSISSGFGTVYAKAQYKTDKTTATVIYTVTNSDYPLVWNQYGLAPTANDVYTVEGVDGTSETQTYVDLTTQDAYAKRDGGNAYHITFIAPDFTQYAHKTYDGAVNGSTDDVFTSVATTGDDNTEDDAGTNVVLDYGDEFYAKMPTTGIVYKLQYAVTACEMQYTNTHHFGTIVLFPGTYTGSDYLFGGAAYYTGATSGSSNFSVGFDASSESNYPNAPKHLSGCKEYRFLGAQAGINAANVSEGTLSSERGSNESIVKGMQVYFLRTGSTGNGAVNIFDGISFTTTSKFSTSAGTGSSDIYNKTNVVTIDVRNCNINTTAATFNLYQNKSTAKANLKVNIRDTYFKNSTSSAYVGKTIASQFHIAGSVIDTSASSAGTVFNIALVSGTANATTITDVSYTCEDSYVALGSGSLFAMDGTATSGLSSSTRNGITFEVKNNTFADASGALVDITANSDATENANMAAITDIIVTGNTVTGSGDLLASYGADYGLRKVNVSGNSFDGFATSAAPAFTGFADDVDFTNNYYTNGGTVISANVASGKVTDIVLSDDLKAYASDFKITKGANSSALSWTQAGTDAWADLSANATAEIPYNEGMTVQDIIDSLEFASEEVSVVSLTYGDGTEITEAIKDTDTFTLTLKHSASNGTLTYALSLPCTHPTDSCTPLEGADNYCAPTCGTDGWQKVICGACNSTVTLTIAATGEHNCELDTADPRYTLPTCTTTGVNVYTCRNADCMAEGAYSYTQETAATGHNHQLDNTDPRYTEPTCTTKGIDVYTCQNENCMADGSKDSYTQETDTVAHTKGDSLEVYAEANCATVGIKAYKCKWFDECDEWMIPTAAMDAYIGGDNTALSGYTEGTDYEILAKGEHNFVVDPDHEDAKAATCTSTGVAVYVCDGCHAEIKTEVDMIAHNYKAEVTSQPTCTDKGVMTYTCSVCTHSYTEEIAAGTGHDLEANVTTPATCVSTGTMTYSCKNCTYSYTEDIPINSDNHNWDDGIVRTAATCVAQGEMLYTCVGCATLKTETIAINANAHKYVAVVTVQPTCTEAGVMTYICSNAPCANSYIEAIPDKGGHKYNDDDWTVTRKATCTREGEEQHLCTVCGEPETRAIAMIDHIWDTEYTVDVKPTGSIEGWMSRHCKLCDAKTDETSLGYCAHENIGEEWYVTGDATCTTDGEKYQRCVDCEDVVNVTVIPAIGHNYVDTGLVSAADCLNGAVYSTICLNCTDVSTRVTAANGHSDSIWFTAQEPTCATDGVAIKYCTECQVDTATKAIPATAHAAGYSWIVINNATCTTAGMEAYACVDCGEYSVTRAIAAIGHQDVYVDDVAATCTEGGYRNYRCTVCGEVHSTDIPATGHTAGEWQIVKIATTLGTGEQVKYCTVCGDIVETEVLEQIVCSGNSFSDVADTAWYNSAVNFVYCSGLMNGTTTTKFAPTASTTRGMFVTILGRLSGIDATKYADVAYFEDVKDGSYYFGYIEWARQNGIVEGTGNFIFQPDRAITRQEMCKIIISYADYEQVELENKNVKTTFTDDSDISNWAKSFVYEAQRAGIVSGDKVGTFRPKDTATRAEVATLIKNFCANYIY